MRIECDNAGKRNNVKKSVKTDKDEMKHDFFAFSD